MRLFVALHGVASDDGAALVSDAIETTQVARDSGYSGVVAGQHFLTGPQAYLQPLPLLARLAPESGEMRLVAGVLVLPLLNAVQLAEDIATVDTLCGGRLIVGVGTGYRQVEFDAFGVDMAQRRRRGLRALDEMVAWWRGEPVRDTGATLGLRPVSSPHPPIWLAVGGPRTYREALERGDTPFIGAQVSMNKLAGLLRSAPGPKAVALRRDVLVTDVVDDSAVAAAVKLRTEQYGDWGYGLSDESPYLIGSVADCRKHIAGLEALGVTDVVIRTNWPAVSAAASREMLVALANA